MGFFLSLSRGAILCFGAALLVYLAFCGKDVRLRLFFLMVEAALVTVILSFPAIRFIASASVMPTILAIACGALIFALDWGIGQRAVSKLTGHGKAVAGAVSYTHLENDASQLHSKSQNRPSLQFVF